MDSFSIIQQFFTRMNCNFCEQPFVPEGIQLVREEQGVYVVSVYCHACQRQIGIAMVGVESAGNAQHPKRFKTRKYRDPELTKKERERLSEFQPIQYDDVLEAHQFFQNLDEHWTQFIPEEMRQSYTVPETESLVE